MDTVHWVALGALTLMLAEGFVLSVFPQQLRQMLLEAEAGLLQAAGLVETCVAVVLMALLLTA